MSLGTVVDPEPPMDRPDCYDYGRYATVEPLFHQYASLSPGDPRRAAVREHLILIHLPLARHLARRFDRRGEPLDDLTQVASVGLIKSLDRFDPTRGAEFLSFAIPTVLGEIRRHFRDHGWAIRVPRRLQELHLAINAATIELSQRNGRAPTAGDLAAHLRLPREEIIEGLAAANAYSSASLDRPAGSEANRSSVIEMIGADDRGIDAVDNHQSLLPLLAQLPPRERQILGLRFCSDLTQSQIAREVGVSQMQVSRLLAATITRLRGGLLAEA